MDGVTGDFTQESRNEEMLKFFVQLISMTKHMVDDILPDHLLLLDKPTVETIVQHCDEFDGSLHVFMKLCGVISKKNLALRIQPPVKQPPSENPEKNDFAADTSVSLSFSNASPQYCESVHSDKKPSEGSAVTDVSNVTCEESHNDDNVWKILLIKVKKDFGESKKLQTFHYCGLCNVRCYAENTWPSHLKGKRHITRSAEVANVSMVCDTCGVHIVSDDQHIAMIMESPEHLSLDEAITREKRACKSISGQESSTKQIAEYKPPEIKPKSDSRDIGNACDGDVVFKGKIIGNACGGDVVFKGKIICSSFAVLTSQISKRIVGRKNFIACYCRPCDTVSKSKEGWVQHISSPKHISLMGNKAFNNVLCMCIQCDFGILASKTIALCYMCYHIEQCHDQSTDNIVHEEYMKMQEITAKTEKKYRYRKSGGSSKQSSFKGSTDSMHLSTRSCLNDEPSDQEMSSRNGQQPSVADSNIEYSGNSTSYQSLADMLKSVKEYGELQGPTRASSQVNLRRSPEPVNRTGGLQEGSLLKYLDDVCVPPKDRKSGFADDGDLKRSKSFTKNSSPGGNYPKRSTQISSSSGMGADDCAQFSGRDTPFSGRSTPSTNTDRAREHGRAVQPANAAQGSSRSSSSASLKGSQESGRSRGNSSNNSASRIRSPFDMDVSFTDGGSARDGVFKKPTSSPPHNSPGGKQPGKSSNRPSPPQESRKFMVSDDNDLAAPFIVMLRHKEIKYQENPSYKPFSALCLFCPNKMFHDAFEWCDHVMTHSSSDIQNEVECSYCNSYVYGNVAEINQLLIPHDEHIRIDRLMRS